MGCLLSLQAEGESLFASDTVHILNSVVRALKPEGHFVAYQYSSIMKHVLKKNFAHMKTRFVMFNVPPAFVYDCWK